VILLDEKRANFGAGWRLQEIFATNNIPSEVGGTPKAQS
jgi:hypothetical protein